MPARLLTRRTLVALVGAPLVLLHAWILAGQVWGGELADPALLARWVAAGGVGWALLSLRRRGLSLLWGRQAVAVWALAALLHGPAALHRAGISENPALPEIVVTVVQVTLAGSLLVGLALLALLRAPARRFWPTRRVVAAHALIGSIGPGTTLAFAPRPPPLA